MIQKIPVGVSINHEYVRRLAFEKHVVSSDYFLTKSFLQHVLDEVTLATCGASIRVFPLHAFDIAPALPAAVSFLFSSRPSIGRPGQQ